MSLFESTEYGGMKVHRDYLVDRNKPIIDAKVSRWLFAERLKMTIEKYKATMREQ